MLILLALPRKGQLQFGGIRNNVTNWNIVMRRVRQVSLQRGLLLASDSETHFPVFRLRSVKGNNGGSFHFLRWVMCLSRNSTIPCVFKYGYACVYVWLWIHVHMCVHVCICVHVCVCEYMCFMYVCIYVYACICTVYVCLRVYMCMGVYVGECVYVCASVWVCCVSMCHWVCTQSVYTHVQEAEHPREASVGTSCQMWIQLLSVLKHYLVVRTLLRSEGLKAPDLYDPQTNLWVLQNQNNRPRSCLQEFTE